jgi:hypothetical protein
MLISGNAQDKEPDRAYLNRINKKSNSPKKTSHDKQHRDTLDHIIRLEPTDDESNITPDLPAHDKRDGKSEKLITGRILRRMIAIDSQDTNVQQVQEQFKTGNLGTLAGSP